MTLRSSILKTLAYYEIFQHPLNRQELFKFNEQKKLSDKDFDLALSQLVDTNKVYSNGEFYSLSEDANRFQIRKELNAFAKKVMPRALEKGKLILTFPFIKHVFISGSLSKGVFNPEDDFDFFIITTQNRIWLAKFYLKCYKFFFLKNSFKEFCINYFMSEKKLEIPEKNIYTATELATMIPIVKHKEINGIYHSNKWAEEYFPNMKMGFTDKEQSIEKPRWSKITEFVFSGFVGDKTDSVIMRFNKFRNKKKYKKDNKKHFDLMFKSTKEESKQHIENNQVKVLESFKDNLIKYA